MLELVQGGAVSMAGMERLFYKPRLEALGLFSPAKEGKAGR